MADDGKEALKQVGALKKQVDQLSKDFQAYAKRMADFEKKQGEWVKKELEKMEKRSVDRHNQQSKEMSSIIAWVKKLVG